MSQDKVSNLAHEVVLYIFAVVIHWVHLLRLYKKLWRWYRAISGGKGIGGITIPASACSSQQPPGFVSCWVGLSVPLVVVCGFCGPVRGFVWVGLCSIRLYAFVACAIWLGLLPVIVPAHHHALTGIVLHMPSSVSCAVLAMKGSWGVQCSLSPYYQITN
jgi:hypothetical protein